MLCILTCMPFNPNVIKFFLWLSNVIFSAMKQTLLNSCGTSRFIPCCRYNLSKSQIHRTKKILRYKMNNSLGFSFDSKCRKVYPYAIHTKSDLCRIF